MHKTAKALRSPLSLLILSLFVGCRAQPVNEVERRVPVDAISECVALRQGVSRCSESVDLFVERRRGSGRPASRSEIQSELEQDAALPMQEVRASCQSASSYGALPSPEDLAHIHRCLTLPCSRRIPCLRPMLLSAVSPGATG